ncbi:MAG: hypothetical protein WAP35_03070 [Solirubrobacterales bacterium]
MKKTDETLLDATRSDHPAVERRHHETPDRKIGPLRVCPECSLAWEVDAQWCPGCGTRFSDRPAAAAAEPSRQSARTSRAAGSTTATATTATATTATAATATATTATGRAEQWHQDRRVRVVLAATLPIVAAAFLLGMLVRPSDSAVNDRIAEAVAQQRSYDQAQASRRLEAQKARLDASADRRVARARSDAFANGKVAGGAAAERAADRQQQASGDDQQRGGGKKNQQRGGGKKNKCWIFDC